MSIAPVAPQGAGIARCIFRPSFPSSFFLSSFSWRRMQMLGALALAVFVPATANAAEDARAVLKKMSDVYRNAKAFEGTVTTRMSGKGKDGKPVTLTQTEQIKYKSSPKQLSVQQTLLAQGKTETKSIYVDGKTSTIYLPAQKKYKKQPVAPQFASMNLLDLVNLHGIDTLSTRKDITFTLLSPTTVQGHTAYVVQIKLPPPSMPPNLPATQKPAFQAFAKSVKPLEILVDKQNYHLLKMSQGSNQGERVDEFGAQTFNGNIANSAFLFTPPAGVTELQNLPENGAPHGASGLPPGLPGRPSARKP